MLIKSIRMILFGVLNNHLKAKDTGALWKIATSKVVYKFPLQERCLNKESTNMLSYSKQKAGES